MKSKAIDSNSVVKAPITGDGIKGVSIRWLIDKNTDNAPNFAVRLFEVEVGGYTPCHSHEWEHEVFCLEGNGQIQLGEEFKEFSGGYAIYVEPNIMHQFKNSGEKPLKFLCMVPNYSY